MKCKAAIWNLMKTQYLRWYLDKTWEILIHSLVMSHLNYTNIILFGVIDKVINKLHRVQNWVGKVILMKYDSSTKARKTIHWLPIWERMELKLLIMVYDCIKGDVPIYVKKLLRINMGYGNLRSNASMKLTIPQVENKTFPNKAFSVVGPRLWNSLPHNIRNTNDLSEFKKSLKTHLFTWVYCNNDNYIYY